MKSSLRMATLAGMSLVWLASCGRRDVPAPEPSEAAEQILLIPESVREKLLEGAMTVLGRLEDYDEPAAFAQVFDRLNQWSHGNPPADAVAVGAWQVDPLFAGLPERLRAESVAAGLEAAVFDATTDVAALRDQRWLADISTMARGEAIDDLDVAKRLFDWTIRNLAIDSDPPIVPSKTNPGTRWFLPGEILLSGRASAAQRSWIFLQLLRHAGLGGVMLATGPADSPRPWVPAVIIGGEAYLFEPTYGLPIPGPGGDGVATARQAAADPAVLAGLSLPDRSYPVQAADMQRLSILVAADPWLLARRMHLLDKRMAGSRAMSLSIVPSAVAQRAREALPQESAKTATAGLWEFPWETAIRRREPAVQAALSRELAVMALAMEQPAGRDGMQRSRILRPLYAARVREFRGEFDGPEGAKAAYLAARPSTAVINTAVGSLPPEQAERVKRLYLQMKEDATYWLGVLTLAEGDTEAAVDYLDRLTLQAAPDSPWIDSARINLARAFAELGRTAEAAALLEADTSPQRFGSRIQADRLEATVP